MKIPPQYECFFFLFFLFWASLCEIATVMLFEDDYSLLQINIIPHGRVVREQREGVCMWHAAWAAARIASRSPQCIKFIFVSHRTHCVIHQVPAYCAFTPLKAGFQIGDGRGFFFVFN